MSHIQVYERLLRQLYGMHIDSPEADEIRDQMDIHWIALTVEERGEVVALCAQLAKARRLQRQSDD